MEFGLWNSGFDGARAVLSISVEYLWRVELIRLLGSCYDSFDTQVIYHIDGMTFAAFQYKGDGIGVSVVAFLLINLRRCSVSYG